MADTEETPSQRQARIRREKREAKITGTAQERLAKITKLSGRTPEMMNNVSPVATPPRTASPAVTPRAPAPTNGADPEQLRAQEEYIRQMLRNPPPQQQPTENPNEDDPMMKMLSQLMGGAGLDPNAAGGGMPSLNPDDLAKATGIPPFLMNMVMGQKAEAPVSAAQQKDAQMWKWLHVVFACVAGIYLLFVVNGMTGTFGERPPAPATLRNPFVIFTMGELLLHGSRMVTATSQRQSGPKVWLQTAKDVGRDASLMVFMLGMYTWWQGLS